MENKNVEVTPAGYFEMVKSRKQVMTAQDIEDLRRTCVQLIDEFQRSGQAAAAKKILFHLDTLDKEAQLQAVGINTYVYKSDVDDYLDQVEDRVVKVIELENYTRRIPHDIIKKIESVRGIFDKMYVVFTDYTKREERKVAAERRERDPILFGTFQNRDSLTVIERFYFIGDWVDEYCDLTLDKMVSEIKKNTGENVLNKIDVQKDMKEVRKSLYALSPSVNGLYREPVRETRKMPLFKRIGKAVNAFKREMRK